MIQKTYTRFSLKTVLLLWLAMTSLIGAAENPDRMAWWRHDRYGMFIHWGLYAIPAGQWNGKTYGFAAEWLMDDAAIPVDQYEQLAKKFNPTRFDADAWVDLACKAGMKYIVITTKHHDGFCLFDSKYTDYDVIDATPFKRDIMRELADACRKRNIKIGWYYSIWDWHHPDYLPRWKRDLRPADGADFNRYYQYMKNQIAELLTNYGQISVLWFDGPFDPTWTKELTDDLEKHIRSLQPDIIINNRIGKPWPIRGDYFTPERKIPPEGYPRADWESCMTTNGSWGFKADDQNWKTPKQIIDMLVDCAARGGNLLLNVGPDADGVIPTPAAQNLLTAGCWLDANGSAVYGTSQSIFKTSEKSTIRFTTGPDRIYIHVRDWPKDGVFKFNSLVNTIKTAYLLADPERKPLPIQRKDFDYPEGLATILDDDDRARLGQPLPDHDYRIVITVPKEAPDPIDSVIVIETLGVPESTWCGKIWFRPDTLPTR